MLIEGVFTSISGLRRRQVAILNLGRYHVTANGWHSDEFKENCSASSYFYAKAAGWSPDDATVYVATTGFKPVAGEPGNVATDPRAGPCDAAMSFPAIPRPVTHTWINYTGCDSLYAVTADESNVYVGGHIRYLDNPDHCDGAGPGAVPRRRHRRHRPDTGRATDWNPGKRGPTAWRTCCSPATGCGSPATTAVPTCGYSQECAGSDNKGGICFLLTDPMTCRPAGRSVTSGAQPSSRPDSSVASAGGRSSRAG